jgi:molecular chaperone DnaK (HSP70)
VKGIDFGTTTSLIAESGPLRTAIVPIGETEKWLPSLAARDGDLWVAGDRAVPYAEEQIIRSAKRAITARQQSFTVFDGTRHVEVDADEAIREILRKLATVSADAFVPLEDESEVRLGCPAMWDGDQRRRLIRLAKEAGISVNEKTVVDEAIAAGIAWVNRRTADGEHVQGKLMVFDMGGGTLDVAVLDVVGRPTKPGTLRIPPIISVQSSEAINEAGDVLDNAMVRDFARRLLAIGFDLEAHYAYQELVGWVRRAAGAAKVELSDKLDTSVEVYHPTIAVPKFSYSREELETAFAPQLDQSIDLVRLALRVALMTQVKSSTQHKSMSPVAARAMSDEDLAVGVKYVVLAGGMAKIPAVRERLGQFFGGDRIWVGADERPDGLGAGSAEMIALGLAHHEDSDRMNLHRPGFDFVLEWNDPISGEACETVVYKAFSPLYTRTQVINLDSVKYTWARQPGEDLPRSGGCLLTVRSLSGGKLDFKFNEQLLPGIRLDFGAGDFFISLEPSGRVYWRDSTGRTGEVRVAQWPVIRGVKQEAIVIEDVEVVDGRYALANLPYHLKPYD